MQAKAATANVASRYDLVLDQIAKERLAQVAAASEAPASGGNAMRRFDVPLWLKWGSAGVGVFLLVFGFVTGRKRQAASGQLPFDRQSLVSVDTVGVRASASDLVPPPAPRSPMPGPASASPSPVPSSSPSPLATPAPRRADAKTGCVDCGRLERHRYEKPFMEAADFAVDIPVIELPAAAPVSGTTGAIPSVGAARMLNVGTRFSATLGHPVRTGLASAPVTAVVASDVRTAAGLAAIPAGATLVGEAFSTRADDRVQINFTALVQNGITVPVRAVAMSSDSQLGLGGKVRRKASRGKSLGRRVAGAVARAATFGLVGSGNPAEAGAVGLLAADAQGDLSTLERSWAVERSDKVVEVAAGTGLVVYVQKDVVLP